MLLKIRSWVLWTRFICPNFFMGVSRLGLAIMDQTERTIQLDQFMKWKGLVSTGGQAKLVIQAGEVRLNGVVETRRKKKLKASDQVSYGGRTFVVDFDKL